MLQPWSQFTICRVLERASNQVPADKEWVQGYRI